ncbi:PREDICTED: zinc finger protein 808-like [Branchiostoma belcheri]|uniref:Zinc finger protein 808-like n=1 Tax=Branchiostoma belcheri TaxID=7741 RepID=A0A6P4ZZV4_BRABE|nr:PREDICTED: zinc finger protein 808-like [Branchiostoma belcheri]
MRKDEGKKMDRPFNGELNQAVTENNNVLVGALQADEPDVKHASSCVEPSVHSSVRSWASLDNQHSKNCHPLHLNGDMQKSEGGKLDACLQCVTQMQHDPKLERHLTTQEKTSSQIFGPSNSAETDSGEEKEGAKKQLHPNVTENHQHVKPATACFKCDRCDFKARSPRRLDAHLRRQHAEGSVRCTLCPFTALNQRGLNMHVRRTHSNKTQEDPDDLEREKNDDISEHLEKHGKTGLLQCPQCDYLTKWRKNMRQHVRDVHTTSHNLHKTRHNLGYKCPDCGHTFRTVSLLRLHVRRKHTGERPFQCPHCSYAALVSSHLERHILRHTGVRPYMCEDCGYMASTKDVLANHRRTHSGEKPYRCEVCGYAARRRHHLQGHMAKHAPVKPDRTFKCEFCDYAAVRKFHLVRHMSRHFGEKPFKCYMCEYSTVDNSRLQAHIRAHTGEKPFRCEMCEFATARKDHLKQHVIRCWRKQTNKQINK